MSRDEHDDGEAEVAPTAGDEPRDAEGRGTAAPAELAQLRAYLLRPEVTDFADALRSGARRVALRPDHGIEGELYLSAAPAAEPAWLDFVRALTDEPVEWRPTPRLSGVLFVRRGDAAFAVTFGYGSLMLRPEAIEPDYGLKVAAGLVDPRQLAQLDARSLEATAVQVRRQSAAGLEQSTFGFDATREMMRAVAGRVADEAIGTRIVGSKGLSISRPVTPSQVNDALDTLHQAYSGRFYQRRFGHIDRWARLEPGPTRDRLDLLLETTLATLWEKAREGEDPADSPARIPMLEAPEIVSLAAAGFRTNREAEGVLHPFPDLTSYLLALDRAPSLASLRTRHRLEMVSDTTGGVERHWRVFDALYWEAELGDGIYVLSEGAWLQVDPGYRDRIDAVLVDIPEAELDRPPKDVEEHEIDYNRRLAAHAPGRAFLDRSTARFEGESGTVEPCDVLTPERQFVHVKPETASTALSHLFSQGYVSARLFRTSRDFRLAVRGFLAGSPALAVVPEEPPDTSQYEVVFAIVTNQAAPIGPTLPFFSRINLARVLPDIESMGYRVRLASIPNLHDVRPPDAGPLFRDEVRQARQTREPADLATTPVRDPDAAAS